MRAIWKLEWGQSETGHTSRQVIKQPKNHPFPYGQKEDYTVHQKHKSDFQMKFQFEWANKCNFSSTVVF